MAAKIKILDTADGDIGQTTNLKQREIEGAKGAYVQCEIGPGDMVVLEGKVDESASFNAIVSWTANSILAIDLPPIFRAKRVIDGAVGNSKIFYQTKDIKGVI